MNSLQIQPHKFDAAKAQIKSISNNNNYKALSLPEFETNGCIIPWNQHNVTGQEMNNFVHNLQSTFMNINNNTAQIYGFITEVYNAFESLDEEYIQGILAAINSASLASDQANIASKKALEACSKADIAQIDIKKTVEALQVTVKTLMEFKQNVLTNLASIDNLSSRITKLEHKTAQLPQDSISHIETNDTNTKIIAHHKYSHTILYVIASVSFILTIGQLVFRIVGIL